MKIPITLVLTATALCIILDKNSAQASHEEPWMSYLYSPLSRSPSPKSIRSITGNAAGSNYGGDFVLSMQNGSHVSLDFGVEVGGRVSFNIATNSSQPLSLAFAESPDFVRPISDDTGAVPTENYDLALNVSIDPAERFYVTPKDSFRGGFRFLTVNAAADVVLSNITCDIGFSPCTKELRDYAGYFYTPDPEWEILNRAWYAGAYTVQTNIAPQNTGRFLPQVKPGWDYNASLGVGNGPFLVDGAKRDRAIWPGDIGLSGMSAALAHGVPGLEAFRNSLENLLYYQNSSTGEFPYAGIDTASFRSGSQSDTYHSWSLISIYNYAMYSGDQSWLDYHWPNITAGIDYILDNIHPNIGLQNQSQPNDWGRQGSGGFNSGLNALSCYVLISFASLSSSTQQSQSWAASARQLKKSYNTHLWDTTSSLYRDNMTTTLHPQDGNALALLFNLTESSSQATLLSSALTRNWSPIGPLSPELPDTISPFISGIELLAHFAANQPSRSLELTLRLWGYMLDAPQFTGSTLVEGMSANGSLYYRSRAGYAGDASYTSLSHGWSSAPTQALLTEVVGLKIVEMGGRKWILKPQLGELTSARGAFETGLGRFEVKVKKVGGGLTAELATPVSTSGWIEIKGKIEVNGKLWDRNSAIHGASDIIITSHS